MITLHCLNTSEIIEKSPFPSLDEFSKQLEMNPRDVCGLVTTPLVVEQNKQGHFFLLYGMNSLRVAKKYGQQHLFSIVLSSETNVDDKVTIINRLRQDIADSSPVIDALVLNEIKDSVTDDQLLSQLELMGHKKNLHTLQRLLSLLDLETSVITAVHKGKITLKNCQTLGLLDHTDQAAISDLIGKYHFGGGKQKLLIDLLVEITKRKACSIDEVLTSWNPHTSQVKNIPQQGIELLNYLKELSSPNLTRATRNFLSFIDQLQLPSKNITITPSQSFEKDDVAVHLTFKNKAHLMENLDKIRDILDQPSS